MDRLEEFTPATQEGNKMLELRIESTEPEAVRDEVDCMVDGYGLAIANYERKRHSHAEHGNERAGVTDEGVFEVDISGVARALGRNIAKLIAKGIVQDHYNGDWSKVRFVGLGEESSPLPPSKGEIEEAVV